jgi:GNAT superfamily N-acetyltransferase
MTLDLVGLQHQTADHDYERVADAAALSAVNEQAYGLPSGEFATATQALKDHAEFYFAREHGEFAACVAALDEGRDCGIYCVATRPSSRRRGLASALIRRALSDARGRGCTTSSLQSSPIGARVYERLGYRDRGALETWEYRSV